MIFDAIIGDKILSSSTNKSGRKMVKNVSKVIASYAFLGVYNVVIYLRFLTDFLRFVFPFFGHFPTAQSTPDKTVP